MSQDKNKMSLLNVTFEKNQTVDKVQKIVA